MKIRLEWSEGAPSQPGDGFRIYRAVGGGSFSLLATLPLTQTTYEDEDVEPGYFYRYMVCEYYMDTNSTPAEGGAGLLAEACQAKESAGVLGRVAQSYSFSATDEGALTAQQTRSDGGALRESMGLQADLPRSESVTVEDAVLYACRDYMEYSAGEAAESEEGLALVATNRSFDTLVGQDTGAPIAQVVGEDFGSGAEKARMGIQHYGATWGLTTVAIEPIQK